METQPDNRLAGFVALKEIEQTGEVEIYYGLAREHWGWGLATEAALAVIGYAFERLDLPRIWARTDPPNAESMRVAKRLSMTQVPDPGGTGLVSFVLECGTWRAHRS